MSRDPLASATLARLYLEQGHLQRARAVLTQVLARTPDDGYALVLARRVPDTAFARISLSVPGEGELLVRWHHVPAPRRSTVTVRWFDRGGTPVGANTFACESSAGRRRLFWPEGARAAAACIHGPPLPDASSGEGAHRVYAVASPVPRLRFDGP